MTECVFCPENWDNLDVVERDHEANTTIGDMIEKRMD